MRIHHNGVLSLSIRLELLWHCMLFIARDVTLGKLVVVVVVVVAVVVAVVAVMAFLMVVVVVLIVVVVVVKDEAFVSSELVVVHLELIVR